MPEETRRHLEELHTRLDEAAAEGSEDAAAMRDRVERYLDTGDPSEEDHEDLLETLGDGARRFDVDHPRLSHTLQGVIDALTASGI